MAIRAWWPRSRREIDRLPFSPRRYTNRTAIALAARLGELAPGALGKVLFAPSGAAAIGMALKLARYATGRHKTLSMWDVVPRRQPRRDLGRRRGALPRGTLGPLLPGTEHVPPLHLARRFFGEDGHAFERLADYIDYVLEVQGDVAARARRADALDHRRAAAARLLAARARRAATGMARC